jgi:hypothetical protein
VPGGDGDGKMTDGVRRFQRAWITAFSRTGYATSPGLRGGHRRPAPADTTWRRKVDRDLPAVNRLGDPEIEHQHTTSLVYSWGLGTDTPVNKKP